MNLRPRRGGEDLEINLVSLIDVVLLLVFFFMTTTTFMKRAEIEVTLPRAGAQAQVDEKAPIEVSIDRQGRFFVNDRGLVNGQVDTVRQALQDAAGGERDPTVVINADRATPHQSVIDVLDAARGLGFVHVTFATEVRPDADR